MDWNRVQGSWKQLEGKVKAKWGLLTDDDLTTIKGSRETARRQDSGALSAHVSNLDERQLEKSPWLTNQCLSWTKVRRVRRRLIVFGLVSAITLVVPIVIGLAGKNVAPNTAQLNTESPAASGSQNP